MGGGLVMISLALAVFIYAIADRLLPRRTRIVVEMEAVRRDWRRYYGWTYLEKPLPARAPRGIQRIGRFVADMLGIRSVVEVRLDQSGLSSIVPEFFVFWHVMAVMLIGAIFYFVSGLVAAIAVIAAAAYAPFLLLSFLAGRRKARIEEQLADTLQLVGGLLRAGHGFPQALAAVTKETEPPISVALKRVAGHVRLGGTIEEGLNKMAVEVDSVALRWAVTAIKIQREVGGNLSEILDTLSRSIRERGELSRQVKALTAEGRFSAYILLAMPFILTGMLYMSNRQYMSLLWTTTAGYTLLGIAAVLMILGTLWLRRIVRVEV